MSIEMQANNKSKTEEKPQQSGIYVQVKQNEGAPIEITSKLNGDRSGDGLVKFDSETAGPTTTGAMTVTTIKPT